MCGRVGLKAPSMRCARRKEGKLVYTPKNEIERTRQNTKEEKITCSKQKAKHVTKKRESKHSISNSKYYHGTIRHTTCMRIQNE